MSPRSFRRSTYPRAPTFWAGLAVGQAAPVVIAAGTKVLLGFLALPVGSAGETVTRIVGSLFSQSDQVSAAEDAFGAMGFILANDLALAAGAASLQGPITDIEDDGWMGYVPFSASFNGAGVGPHHYVTMFDQKGQRKVQEGQGLAIMIENASAVHGLEVSLVLRVLTKETRG